MRRPLSRPTVVTAQPDDDPGVEDSGDFLPPLPCLSRQYGPVNRHGEEDPQDVQGIAELRALTVLAVGEDWREAAVLFLTRTHSTCKFDDHLSLT